MTQEPSNELAIMESRIPDFDNEDKVKYLQYRAVGFNKKESAHLAEVLISDVNQWLKDDASFKDFERKNLRELQKVASKDIIELEFLRNVMMFARKDARIIQKSMQVIIDPGTKQAIDGMELLTDREWEYFKAIRKHYTPDQLLQLNKALTPDEYRENKVVVLTWDGRPAPISGDDIEGFSVEIIDE